MSAINHGCGVVEFPYAFDVDDDFLGDWLERRREHEPDDYYIDTDGTIVNRGGFKFKAEEYSKAPGRFLHLLHSETSPEDVEFVKNLDDALRVCLDQYLTIFPEATASIWWESDGHIATYDDGQHLGIHSDNGIHYSVTDGRTTKVEQDAMHNVISSSMVLRAPVEGGELNMPHAGLTLEPIVGTAVLYPSNFVGAHGVSPVVSGERWSYLKFWGSSKARQYPREVSNMEEFATVSLPVEHHTAGRQRDVGAKPG
jgi:hypothetical protein